MNHDPITYRRECVRRALAWPSIAAGICLLAFIGGVMAFGSLITG